MKLYRKHAVKLFWVILFLTYAGFRTMAADERFSKVLRGTEIQNTANVKVEDDKYPQMSSNSSWNQLFCNSQVLNYIKLSFDLNELIKIPACSITVSFDLDLTDDAGNVTPYSSSLTIDYDPSAGAVYKNIDVYEAIDGHVSDLTITGVSTSGISASEIPDVVILENEIYVVRYYALKPYMTPTISQSVELQELVLKWPKIEGAIEYEIQWTFIDDYDGGTGSITASNLEYNFRWNSGTMTTVNNFVRLPLLYDKGYLIYRARTTGKKGSYCILKKIYGDWSLPASGTVSSALGSAYHVTTPFMDDEMNWNASLSYTQNGQYFRSVQFYDGLLKTRQSVSYNESIEQAIVSEVYYDHYGRAAVSSIPAPSASSSMEYYDAFNTVVGYATPYSKTQFDLDDGANDCLIDINGMNTTYGTSNYFSYLNTNEDGSQGFVAQAERFPFTQVEFTSDNTGRVKRVSLPGPDHHLESGHEMLIEYTSPSQVILNHLFGTDVGLSNAYTRVITTDANGQATSKYLDGQGRVIATSVIGVAPEGMHDLDNEVGASVTPNFQESLRSEDPPNTQYEITKEFYVESAGNFDFEYQITPESFTDECIEGFCFDCYYDLSIQLYDDCGDLVLDANDDPVIDVQTTIGPTTIDDVCTTIVDFVSTVEDVILAKGNYTIIKKLSLNLDHLDYFTEKYIEHNTCMTTYEEFLTEELDGLIDMNCDLSPCELEFLDTYGDEESFISEGGTAFEYNELFGSFIMDCTKPDPCENLLQALMADVSPGGQYAEFYDLTNYQVDPSVFPLSVLNTANQLGTNEHWRNPAIAYEDQDGNPDYITLAGGSQVVPGHSSVSLATFIHNWKPSWAKSLVQYHPEYCFYESCLENNTSGSNDWDYYFDKTFKFSVALSSGYFNPLDQGTTEGVPAAIPANSLNTDPFFNFLPGSVHHTDMVNAMQNYFTIGSTTFTLWEMALLKTFCPDALTEGDANTCLGTLDPFGTPGCDVDVLWETYKRLYKSLKWQFTNEVAVQHSIENYCYNGCIGVEHFDPDDHEFKTSGFYNSSQPCHSGTESLYTNKIQRYPTYTPDLETGQTLAQDCEDICTEKAQYWMDALTPCELASYESAIMAELIELCSLGCDALNFEGSSTLPTGVTTTNGNASVDEVIAYHLSNSGYKSETCSPWLISDPMPYGYFSKAGQQVLDDCACDRLLQNQYDFDNLSSPIPGVNDGGDYFAYQYGLRMTFYDSYVCRCDEVYYDEYSAAWTPSNAGNWNLAAKAALEELAMPTFLNLGCNTCFTCEMINDAVTDVVALHGFSTNYDYYNLILTNYINSTYFTNFSTSDILTFIEQCDIANESSGEWCSTMYSEAEDLEETLNELIDNGDLLNYTSTASNLMAIPGFDDGDLEPHTIGHFFWAESTTTATSLQGNFNIGVIAGDDQISECQLQLQIPSGQASYVDLGHLLAVENIDFAASINGLNYGFVIDATFDDPSSSTDPVIEISGSSTCYPIRTCYIEAELALCTPEFEGAKSATMSHCVADQIQQAEYNALQLYETEVAIWEESFRQAYVAQCSLAIESEQWTKEGLSHEYHYTLYYYDQAGNLVKTIPPKGVDHSTIAKSTAASVLVDAARKLGTVLVPSHTMASRYRYNTRDQLVLATSPDGGTTKYWYDHSGKLIYSQNAVQALALPPQYSYTLYDEHERIMQVGQVATSLNPNDYLVDRCDVLAFSESGTGNIRTEVTHTFYDEPVIEGYSLVDFNSYNYFEGGQSNLQKRIAVTATYSTFTYTSTGPPSVLYDFDNAYIYNYDDHGMVKEVVFDVPRLETYGQRKKRTRYDYDLKTGNLTQVEYQYRFSDGPTEPDWFLHRYFYDENNRLKSVETSKDYVIWDQDAKYFYYDHGPLARVEIGENKVHGQDYYYTIHGWLKGVNSNALDASRDPGNDGTLGYLENFNKIHKTVAEDAFGYSLSFYEDDYSEIEPLSATNHPVADLSGSTLDAASVDLFNGNIRHMVTSIGGGTLLSGGSSFDVQATAYEYDQINRLKTMVAFQNLDLSTNAWGTTAAMDDYAETYTYDPNGNIKTLTRKGYGANLPMDGFTYDIPTGYNKLDHIDDNVTSAYMDDIDDQNANNYTYNAIGQLTSDVQENITNISWTISGRVKQVTIAATPPKNIEFEYDAFGNRIMKLEHFLTSGVKEYTYYAHGADGTVMSIYDHTYEPGLIPGAYTYTAKLSEVPLYGSGTLGTYDRHKALYLRVHNGTTATNTAYNPDPLEQERGRKQYQLANHLGNVLATISDIKLVTDGEEQMNDDFTSTVASWASLNSGTVTLNTTNGRLDVSTSSTGSGTYKNLTTVAGEVYSLILDIDNNTISSVKYAAVDVGSGVPLGEGNTNSNGVVTLTFVAQGTTTAIRVSSNTSSSGTFYLNSAKAYIAVFAADYHMRSDYYPFGMPMPGRVENMDAYRFGLNGMEKDNEFKGTGNHYTTDFRQYDPRAGRWMSIDPVVKSWESPYAAFANNPIFYTDPSGLDPVSWIKTLFQNIKIFAQNTFSGKSYGRQIKYKSMPNFIDKLPSVPNVMKGDVFVGAGGTLHRASSDAFTVESEPTKNRVSHNIFFDNVPNQDFSGFWGKAKYFWNGGNIDGIRYNVDGQATSIAPTAGMPPSIIGGPLRKGQEIIKVGKYFFNPTSFHSVKEGVLAFANPKNFQHIVGSNPDIMFKGGKVFLTGAKNSGYFGKSYPTEMTIAQFLNLF